MFSNNGEGGVTWGWFAMLWEEESVLFGERRGDVS